MTDPKGTGPLRRSLFGRERTPHPPSDLISQSMRQRVMLPLTLGLICLVVAFAGILAFDQHEALTSESERAMVTVTRDLDSALHQQAQALSGLITLIAEDPETLKALEALDRDRLLALHTKTFQALRTRHHVTHFYFHRPDRVNLVRIHVPSRFGDIINRTTMIEAAVTGREASGIELGPLGTFTLRVVRPLYEDNDLIGFVELGMEIEALLSDIATRRQVVLVLLIDKSFLNRRDWERGMKMLGRKADWGAFDREALIYQSQDPLPEPWSNIIRQQDAVSQRLAYNADLQGPVLITDLAHRQAWHLMSHDLEDVASKPVGRLVLVRDISAKGTLFLERLLLLAVLASGVIGVLLLGLYAVLRNADRAISAQQDSLMVSKERLALATEAAGVAIWDVDLSTDTHVWDDRMFELYGLNPQRDKPGKEVWRQMLHPLDRDQAEQDVQAAVRSAASMDMTFRVVQPCGKVRYLRSLARVFDGEDGQPQRMIGVNYDITDLIEARRTRDALAAVVENTDSIVVVKDLELRVMATNMAFARACGWQLVEDMLGHTEAEIFGVSPESEPIRSYMADDRYAQTLPRGEVLQREEPVVYVDGSVHQVLTRKHPIYTPEGVLLGTGHISVDITERKQLETELARSEGRFRDIVETMSDFVWELDTEGRLTYCSGGFEDILGYNRKDFLGQNPSHLVTEESLATFQDAFDAAKRSRKAIRNLEVWCRCRNGTLVCLLVNGVPVISEDGHLTGFRGTNADITRRKRMEEILTLRDRALAAAANGIVITSAEGDLPVVYINPAFERITGYPAQEVLGQNLRILYGDQDHQSPLETLRTLLQTGFQGSDHFTGLLRNLRKDGTWFWNRLSVAPVRDPSGRITHFVGVQEDVSENQRRAQELQRAREDAERANRAKSDFLAKMSHELRTPLNAIIGFSDVMRGELFGALGSPQYKEYIEDIHKSGEFLLALINDILDMAKIEAGRLVLSEEDVHLADVVRSVLDMIAPNADRRGVVTTFQEPTQPLALWADERAVKQMIMNLVSNAVKFTPKGGTVTVAAMRTTEDGGVMVTVTDTGIGIRKEDLETVLEPFQQARSAQVSQEPGTGLGLSLVRSLIELHDGTLSLNSTPNVGTQVTLWFPPRRVRSVVGTGETA